MAAETGVRVRIGREVKEQAEAVLAEIGLSIPGEVANAETIAAMKELESGNLKSYATVRELMDDLKADD
jgi:antitoxin component of RelBE/YafQ-DinJ toxin-antitoxin module